MTPEQLKASILQRAMEGKLVPQNPNDEPASELLKRIKAEKEKLISEGKIKRDKKETEIFRGDDGKHYGKFADGSTQEIDVPYDIPDTWEWVRFSTLVEIVRGGSPRPIKDYLTSEVDGINWIKIGDTEKGEKYINNVKEKIKKSGLNKTRFVKKGTFLLTNSMSFGRPYILNVDGAIHDGWLAISNYENSLNKDYLFYILSSNVVYSQFLSLISGAVVKNLNSDKVASILIPLPPLSEQQRIIEAIESAYENSLNKDYLFYILSSNVVYSQFLSLISGAVVKNLNSDKVASILIPLPPLSEQQRIVEAIESALEKVDEYAESYNRLEQLDKEFPDKLKKSILQYAMQGKLVEQDPNDESVEVLLEKIRAEKQKLFEEGKIKKKDLDISIVSQGDDNSYYGNIPMNWVVIKIKDIFSMNTGLSYKKGDLSINNKGVRIIRGGNIKPLEFSLLDNDYYIDTQFISSEQVYLKHNQLITPVSTSLEHIGKFARIDKDYDGVVAGGFIFQLTPFESSEIISKFLLFNLSSPLFYKQLKAITKLSGQALYNIPKTTLSELLIPLAPFEEQELITQKVEKLFEKVNQLWK
ncbi:restriction endonuclease subunit S [Streptococcus pneumoniae]|uniref:restriction endonuclease subunit S n=7 Tax=Streptococcus pneumoniae TaxID=1313 RepID=UPI00061C38D2|nr:restriction endonuclease subunit S [Streptococcus pneumoniae]CGE85518.1 type I restriction enzyme%2C S subunit [Streptococcus pneumoniae]